MKALVVTDGYEGREIAQALEAEGHQVVFFNRLRKDNEVGSILAGVKLAPDLVVFDSYEDALLSKRIEKSGVRVIGTHPFGVRASLDPEFMRDFTDKLGIRRHDYTRGGMEFFTQVWFSRGVPVTHPIGFIMNSNALTHMWNFRVREPKSVQLTIKKMYPGLRAVGYTGPFTAGVLVDDKNEAYMKSFSVRFEQSKYVARLVRPGLGGLLLHLAEGRSSSVPLNDYCFYGDQMRDTLDALPRLRQAGFEVPLRASVKP